MVISNLHTNLNKMEKKNERRIICKIENIFYLVDVLVSFNEIDTEFPKGRRSWITKPMGYPGLHSVNIRGRFLRNPTGTATSTGTPACCGGQWLFRYQTTVKGCATATTTASTSARPSAY